MCWNKELFSRHVNQSRNRRWWGGRSSDGNKTDWQSNKLSGVVRTRPITRNMFTMERHRQLTSKDTFSSMRSSFTEQTRITSNYSSPLTNISTFLTTSLTFTYASNPDCVRSLQLIQTGDSNTKSNRSENLSLIFEILPRPGRQRKSELFRAKNSAEVSYRNSLVRNFAINDWFLEVFRNFWSGRPSVIVLMTEHFITIKTCIDYRFTESTFLSIARTHYPFCNQYHSTFLHISICCFRSTIRVFLLHYSWGHRIPHRHNGRWKRHWNSVEWKSNEYRFCNRENVKVHYTFLLWS